MSLAKILYQLKAAENQIADIYDFIALNTSLTYPDLSELFSQLADDERLHEKEVAQVQAIFSTNANEFELHPANEYRLDEFLAALAVIHSQIKERFQLLTPADLLENAVNLESHLIEQHRQYYLTTTNSDLQRLLNVLLNYDQIHYQRVIEIAKQQGITLTLPTEQPQIKQTT